ncbi:hypothetical protein FHW83_001264 [Duganella sp. SG902]|uniref:hypothetical protein n=1 Tax=Duganella sp. SG902 TaxID=2587016 RepID=UPI00159DFCC5|nr:hypothetical protein [Duganella sp. SG902]NVM75484.1 hypothetical protein [Duganella sp. SG902]
MTAAFDTFMHQYQMSGSDKADGYGKDALAGLTSEEQKEVFNLLLTELPFSVEWLFFLDAEKALAVAKEYEAKWRCDGDRHVYKLQQHIVQHTGDWVYQQRMIEDYPHYVGRLRLLAIDAVHRTPANAATMAFLEQVILTETDERALARACRHLLGDAGLSPNSDNYQRLLNSLRSDSIATKLAAFTEIHGLT